MRTVIATARLPPKTGEIGGYYGQSRRIGPEPCAGGSRTSNPLHWSRRGTASRDISPPRLVRGDSSHWALNRLKFPGKPPPVAFSSEVYNGSREENASKHEIRAELAENITSPAVLEQARP
jgi:hypothetical protein